MAPRRPLTRSRSDRVIAGVCGGLADWLGWPAGRVRLLYVVVSLVPFLFPGLLVYLLLWAVLPNEATAT